MSDVRKFNLFVLFLLLFFAAIIVAGCCPKCYDPMPLIVEQNEMVDQRNEWRRMYLLAEDSLTQFRARERVDQWKREGWK